jgi:DNA-directed RNA polymerase specialized sigma24 family protein
VTWKTTHWSAVQRAGEGCAEALEEILRDYLDPLYLLAVRGLGVRPVDAEDLIQAFFLQHLIANNTLLAKADPGRGSFQGYIRTVFRNFVRSQWRTQHTQRRSPGGSVSKESASAGLPTDERGEDSGDSAGLSRRTVTGLHSDFDPEQPEADPAADRAFDRAFVLCWFAATLSHARTEWMATDPRIWHLYLNRELLPNLTTQEPPAYEAIYEAMGYASAKQAMDALTTAKRALMRNLETAARERMLKHRRFVQEAGQEVPPATAAEIEEAVAKQIADLREVLGPSAEQGDKKRRPRQRTARPRTAEAAATPPRVPLSVNPDTNDNWYLPENGPLARYLQRRLNSNPPADRASMMEDLTPLLGEAVDEDLSCLLRLLCEDARDEPSSSDPQQLRALLDRWLEQPIEFSMAGLEHSQAERIRREAESHELLLASLGDLLRHAHPPTSLLEAAKTYAHAYCTAPKPGIPGDVAMVLYYGSIVAARIRTGHRITKLKDQDLAAGIEWVLEQTWVDDSLKSLMREGLQALRKKA